MDKSINMAAAQKRLETASRSARSARTKLENAQRSDEAAQTELREANDQFTASARAVVSGSR